MQDYTESFEKRGHKYDQAVRRYPSARDEEFKQMVARLTLQRGFVVADVPAGGGYLKKYLPVDCALWEHEPCASFGPGAAKNADLLPLPWVNESVDAAVSLAGIHHLADKGRFFEELFRVVKPGGQLVLSDVAQGSTVAKFLDGYVGDNNSTGHEGLFISDVTLEELCRIGWQLVSRERVRFHWVFDNDYELATFTHCLFDLQKTSIQDTLDVIVAELGIDTFDNGKVGMRWELVTIVAERPNTIGQNSQ